MTYNGIPQKNIPKKRKENIFKVINIYSILNIKQFFLFIYVFFNTVFFTVFPIEFVYNLYILHNIFPKLKNLKVDKFLKANFIT